MTSLSSWQPGISPQQPSVTPAWLLQAATGLAGFALQNATPNLIVWTAPNDGQLHRCEVVLNKHVTVAETGGAVNCVASSSPDGAGILSTVSFAGGQGVGVFQAAPVFFIPAGGSVTVRQSSALTAGASVVWAEIWGS